MTRTSPRTLRGRLRRLRQETAYLLTAFPIAVAAFAVAMALIPAGIGTVVVWVGLPILFAGLHATSGLARVERGLAHRFLHEDPPPPMYKNTDTDAGWWRRLLTPMTDPQRWLDALWSVLNFAVSVTTFVITVTWWALPLTIVGGPIAEFVLRNEPTMGSWNFAGINWIGAAFLHVVTGLIGLLTLPWLIHAMTLIQSGLSNALLSKRARYHQRISTLTESRSAGHRAEVASLSRLERDIHDGPQQRLVRLQLDLARAERASANDPAQAAALLAQARVQASETLTELRQLSRGIAPPVLADRGLEAALDELAARSDVWVTVDCSVDSMPLTTATTLYFVIAEAVTNINKHSCATQAGIRVTRADGDALAEISDNGIGGASIAKGHGLAGLNERIQGTDGTLTVTSPAGGPTQIRVRIPWTS